MSSCFLGNWEIKIQQHDSSSLNKRISISLKPTDNIINVNILPEQGRFLISIDKLVHKEQKVSGDFTLVTPTNHHKVWLMVY